MHSELRTALIVGATGLVGNELLHLLLSQDLYEKVVVLVRKQIQVQHDKLVQKVIDFDSLDDYEQYLAVDDVFCCLGTTIKKAGSEEAFKKVDYEYPLKVAQLAKKNGVQQFLIISAIGADSSSKIFYNRTKGEVEDALMKIGFPSLHIFQPSLLVGKRNEFRFGEKLGIFLSPIYSPLLRGKLSKYKPVQANLVAMSMCNIAKKGNKGNFVYQYNDKIKQFCTVN